MNNAPTGAEDFKGFSYDPDTGLAKFSIYLPNGKGIGRARKQLHAATVEDAMRAFLAFQADVLAGKPGQPVMTFRQFINKYFTRIVTNHAKRTAGEYRRVIDNHLLPEFGDLRLDAITNAEVDAFDAKLAEAGLTLSTRNDYIAILRLLLRRASDVYAVIPEYPLKPMKRKRPPALRLELSDNERERLFRTFDDPELFMADLAKNRVLGSVRSSERFDAERRFGGNMRPGSDAATEAFRRFAWAKELFVVAVETGLRKSDLLSLKFENVHFSEGEIRLMMQKTGQPVRIPISDTCRAALLVCRERSTTDQVFTDEEGRAFSMTRMHRTFDRAKRIAGITRRLRIHDLRHTFASRLASRNVNAILIRDALGHASLSMSSRYAKAAPGSLDIVRAALNGG